MKLKFSLLAIIITLLSVSCSKSVTEYNAYIKNDSDNTIHCEIIGDSLVLDSISIPSGITKKIYHKKEEGDFEIYDCRSFFDTVYYSTNEKYFSILKDSASITSTSDLTSDETRVHDCVIEIK